MVCSPYFFWSNSKLSLQNKFCLTFAKKIIPLQGVIALLEKGISNFIILCFNRTRLDFNLNSNLFSFGAGAIIAPSDPRYIFGIPLIEIQTNPSLGK
jgi:hypothetical protein